MQLIGKVNPTNFILQTAKIQAIPFYFLQNIAKNILPNKVSDNQAKDIDKGFKVSHFLKKHGNIDKGFKMPY